MDQTQADLSFHLILPAGMDYLLVARMTLTGFGMLTGLDVDQIDDLRIIADECCSCLLHQGKSLKEISISSVVRKKRFCCCFIGERATKTTGEPVQDKEITRCVLETLLPDVHLHHDEYGVYRIDVSMPL